MKKILQLIILAVILSFILYYICSYPNVFNTIKNIDVKNILIIFSIDFLFLLSNSLILKLLLGFFELTVPLKECLGISSVATMVNYLAPFGGGAMVKAVYLKK